MSEYGMEIYNSSGELIFTSSRKSLQVIQSGTITISEVNTPYYATFPAMYEEPEFVLFCPGLAYSVPASPYTYIWMPTGGPFITDSYGRYYRLQVKASRHWQTLPAGANVSGTTNLPWQIPYVIFV